MRFPRRLLLIALGALALNALAAPEPFTDIAAVRALSRQDAATGLPLKVRAVVTWRGDPTSITVQDETAGIWLHLIESIRRGFISATDPAIKRITVGDELEIEGLSDAAGYAPVIVPRTIRVLGRKELPAPRPLDRARFFNGADDSQRVAVQGVVQGYQSTELGWLLQMDANPGRFTVQITAKALPDPSELVDAVVTVTGVATSRFNTRGELTLPRVFCSLPDQLIVNEPAQAPFEAPLVPLDDLLPFSANPLRPHRQRVVGTITYAIPGKFFFLQEGDSAVRVETRSTESWRAGDRVEASGFVDMSRAIGTLVDAQVRKTGTGPLPEPVTISPKEIIELNLNAMRNGQRARPHDFDGHLVRFRAELLAVQTSPGGLQPVRQLTLAHDDMIFSALYHDNATEGIDALQPGSEIEITALVQLQYTPVMGTRQSLMPTRLDVILRDAKDITIIRAPSWWTAGRLLAIVAVVAVALGAMMLWAWQLRRQIQRKTQQLATEMSARRDAAIEFQATLRERTRLAANLHDTLLQTLGGIGFQIEACEAEAEVAAPAAAGQRAVHLPVARKMLDHAVDELRGSVWALRSLPLQGMALPDALRSLTDRAGAGHDIHFDVHAEGDLSHVPDFVAGNLLLAAQEAVHNAIKHGRARHIRIEVRPAERPEWIALKVRDDGRGFTPGSQAGAPQGHFGLVGMRERLDRLNGTLTITSAPGQGTTILLEVPLRAYDEALA